MTGSTEQIKRVAVTGGNGGIGNAICTYLAKLGWQTYSLDRAPIEGSESQFIAVDLLDTASINRAVAEIYADGDAPVSLVTSAGIVEDNVAAEELDIDLVDRVMGVNFRGVFLTNQAFGRELLTRGGGSIVNVASMSGNHVVNYPQRQAIYNSSKAAVVALTKSLAVEWGPRNVRVNALSPGYIDTPLNGLKTHMHEQWNKDTVLNRMGTPEEAAAAVEFLLSSRSGYFLGAELLMDGGFSLR